MGRATLAIVKRGKTDCGTRNARYLVPHRRDVAARLPRKRALRGMREIEGSSTVSTASAIMSSRGSSKILRNLQVKFVA